LFSISVGQKNEDIGRNVLLETKRGKELASGPKLIPEKTQVVGICYVSPRKRPLSPFLFFSQEVSKNGLMFYSKGKE
jgi:hypothetical protein